MGLPSRLLKYAGGDGMARLIWRKSRSLPPVNEDFFALFNAARPSKVEFQQAASNLRGRVIVYRVNKVFVKYSTACNSPNELEAGWVT